jgi:hypothetical protein
LAKLLRKKTKGVASAFSEVATFPGIYLGKLNLDQASLASVVDSTQKELEHLQSGLHNEIEQKVSNKLSTVPPMGLNSAVAEDIVSKIHDAILLEYSAKFSSSKNVIWAQKRNWIPGGDN